MGEVINYNYARVAIRHFSSKHLLVAVAFLREVYQKYLLTSTTTLRTMKISS